MEQKYTLIDRERLKAVATRLKEEYGAQRVIVFGSAARGDATDHSDLDLLVISPTRERFFQRVGSVLGTVRDLTWGIPLSPIVLTPQELQARLDRGDQFVQEILSTGLDL